MDYLTIVNEVLKRMRENTVTSLYQNQQSTVVASLVNDAKRFVEDAHAWSAYETDFTFATVDGSDTYSLTGSQNRGTIVDVLDTTNGAILTQVGSAVIRQKNLVADVSKSRPSKWSLDGVDGVGDDKMRLFPTPDGTYNISVHMYIRAGDLTAEGDVITIPTQPIIHMAHTLAAQERGDISGADAQQLASLAKKSLGDAIMYDAAKSPERMVWYPV